MRTRYVIRKVCIFFIILFSYVAIQAQEICDNGIDDDGDSLIDLNDEDCICNSFIESSLIPNPSFEDMTCCPTANEMLNCANGWIQASGPTTDYVHTCEGYLGNTSIPAFAPLPFPDGEGAVGFRDGQFNVGPNYKEYVGACLTESMIVGTSYRFDFFVGFRDNVPGSLSFNMAIFGSTNCSNLPFGGGNITIGCPANTGNYDELGQIVVSGSNQWVNVVIEFVADKAYEVIVLGPSCAANPNYIFDPYFYVDRLAFEEVGEFGTPLENVSGSICENNLVLSVADDPNHSYQWYQDGVALIGETNSSIALQADLGVEGIYLVAITTDEGCSLSRAYDLRIPPYYAPIEIEICANEDYTVGTETFDESGYFEITIPALDGCDSIVQLSLQVDPITFSNLQESFCQGDTFSFYDINTSIPGIFETVLTNEFGCDSIIQVELTEISQGIGVQIAESFELNLGESISIAADSFDPILVSFTWYNENNEVIGEELLLKDYQVIDNTLLYLESFDQHGCGIIDTIQILVDKTNIGLYVPNVFSPNSDGINDFFRFYVPISLSTVEEFFIFDRWGNIVYQAKDLIDLNSFLGWDGIVRGKEAAVGVYVYFIRATFFDGTEKLLKGDVMLIR